MAAGDVSKSEMAFIISEMRGSKAQRVADNHVAINDWRGTVERRHSGATLNCALACLPKLARALEKRQDAVPHRWWINFSDTVDSPLDQIITILHFELRVLPEFLISFRGPEGLSLRIEPRG